MGLWTMMALGTLLVPAAAAAGKLDLGAQVMVGAAGEAEAHADGDEPLAATIREWVDEDDLEPTAGLGVFVMYEVWDYIDIGGTSGFLWWQTEEMAHRDIDRSFLWDLDFRLKGKYDELLEDEALELYGSFSIGFTLSIPNQDLDDELEGILHRLEPRLDDPVEMDVGVGLNAALSAGASYLIIPEFGVFAELGWMFHWATHEVGVPATHDYADLSWSTHQFGLNIGCYYSAL